MFKHHERDQVNIDAVNQMCIAIVKITFIEKFFKNAWKIIKNVVHGAYWILISFCKNQNGSDFYICFIQCGSITSDKDI